MLFGLLRGLWFGRLVDCFREIESGHLWVLSLFLGKNGGRVFCEEGDFTV